MLFEVWLVCTTKPDFQAMPLDGAHSLVKKYIFYIFF